MNARPLARLFVSLVALSVVGCIAPVGAQGVSVPKDGATQCASQCSEMGLRLSAVAVMANHVGCVCQPPEAPRAQSAEAVPAAGMATVMLLEQQRQQQQQQQQPQPAVYRR